MSRREPGMLELVGQTAAFRRSWRSSLIFQQTVLFGGALICFIVLLATIGWSLWTLTRDQHRVWIMFEAEKIVRNIDSDFLVIGGNVESVANLTPLLPVSPSEYRRIIGEMVETLHSDLPMVCGGSIAFAPEYAHHAGIGMWYVGIDADGEAVGRNVDPDEVRYYEEEWFTDAMDGERSDYWCSPYDDPISGVMMTTCSVAIQYKGEFVGVITVDVSLERLDAELSEPHYDDATAEMEREIRSSVGDRPIENIYAFLITREGFVISHPNRALMLHDIATIPELRPPGEPMPRVLRDLLADRNGGIAPIQYSDRFSGRGFICCTPLLNADWTLVLVFPDAILFPQFLAGLGIAVVILLTLVVGIVVIYRTRRTLKPLDELAEAARKIGRGELSTPVPYTHLQNEVGAVSHALADMQQTLGEYIDKVRSTAAASQRMASELRLASAIQRWLLPAWRAPYTRNNCFELAAYLEAARSVGGDLYDFRLAGDRLLYLVIGDVSGKEISGALFMAVTQTLQRGYISGSGDSPGEILTHVNRDLNQNNTVSMFVTLFLGRLDLATGEFRFCNAGHNPPYRIKASGELQPVEDLHGPPLGAVDYQYRESCITLEEGETLVLYTDGVTEAQNPASELYGTGRLEMVLKAQPPSVAPALRVAALRKSVEEFIDGSEPSDDVTMLMLKLKHRLRPGETVEA